MRRILLFSGTTEGRTLAEFLGTNKIETLVFVATAYGETLMEETKYVSVQSGRLSSSRMSELFTTENPLAVVDATHPFATEVTENIKIACENMNIEYIRLLRDMSKSGEACASGAIYVENIPQAVAFINSVEGNVLVTTGSKEIHSFTAVKNYKDRVFVRILPIVENLKLCTDMGFMPQNMICMQGPFSQKANESMLEFSNAKYLVTKETGEKGGFFEKISACQKMKVTPVVIGSPKEMGFSYDSVKERLLDLCAHKPLKKVFVIGGGMATMDTLTVAGAAAIDKSSVIITTKRIYAALDLKGKTWIDEYRPRKIKDIIEASKAENISVIFSGDIGFYSGASALRNEQLNCEIEYISGISSLAYFMNRLGKDYGAVKTISLHGRDDNLVGNVVKNKAVLILLGGENTAAVVAKTLAEFGFGGLAASVGESLGGEEEVITVGKVQDFVDKDCSRTALMLIENTNPISAYCGFDDVDFIRKAVPMTKSEVRAVSLSKLKLTKNAVVYDVGAGTGSISCEAALLATDGTVYAIEKEEHALELVEENKRRLGAYNVKSVLGLAPLCLGDLKTPTHVFIGGSSGNLKSILLCVLNKNAEVRVVINAISLETVQNALDFLKEHEIDDYEVVNITVSRNRRVGKTNIMEAQNPIYIISFTGKKRS